MQSLAPEDVIRIHSASDEGVAIIQADLAELLLPVLGLQGPSVSPPGYPNSGGGRQLLLKCIGSAIQPSPSQQLPAQKL